MRWVRRMLLSLLIGLGLLVALLLWMAGGIQAARTFEAPPETVPVAPKLAGTRTSTGTVRVVVWNIAWAYGWGSEGTGGAKPREYFEGRLAKMADVLTEARPDLVLMQEVDFASQRSHGVDQARYLAERVGLPYVAKAVSWRANYLPFPYWPPKDHYGRIESGGAILSRFPIQKNVVELYPKPEENGFVYNLGYVFRYLQRAEIDIPGGTAPVFNAHLDAFSPTNRQAHAGHIARRLADDAHPRMLFGADLNTVPPEATLRSGYPDEPETSHEDDPTVPRLRAVEGLTDTLSEQAFTADEAAYATFPAHAPNRKLDYLFAGTGYEVVRFEVLRQAGDVSDHLPIFAELRLRAE